MYASPTQPQSQPHVPSMTSSSSARPLQLDQWANTKAPLTSSQRASVNRLAEWLHRNSADFKQHQQQQPFQVRLNDPVASPDDTPQSGAVVPSDEPIDTKNAQASTSASDPIVLPDSTNPLASAQSFLAWYTQLSDSVTSSTQTSHLAALQHISDTTSTADALLAQLEACQVNVSELRAGTAFVQDSSRGIREQAQALLDSQTHLDTLAEDVASRLSFFTLLPYATNMLSSPDSSIVYSQAFLELMDQLEMALLFLQQDPARTYRDAALYRMRYSQCVTRAATLAKMAVVRDIKAEAERAADQIKRLESHRGSSESKAEAGASPPTSDVKGKARELADSTAPTSQTSVLPMDVSDALFGDAARQVTRLRPLIFELQKRASNTASSSTPSASTAAEFESLLQECRTAWYQFRRPLFSRILLQRITEIETQANTARQANGASHPTVHLARAGADLLRHVLQNEYELYQQFFGGAASTGEPPIDAEKQGEALDAGLATYLSELAETVTARLRPKLAKEDDILILAQISSSITDAIHTNAPPQSNWSRSLLPLLNESQSRLVSRAQAIISNDIAHFTPSEEDGELDFPERIQRFKSSSTSAPRSSNKHRRGRSGAGLLDAALSASHAASTSTAQQEKVQLFTLPPALASTYYPPVGYMLELLYHLQAKIPAGAFRKVASDAVEACMGSVSKGAGALVKRKKGDIEKEDALLFELRQLEILRETVVSASLVLKQAHDIGLENNKGLDNGGVGVGSGAAASLVDLSALVTAINSLWTNTGRLLYPSAVASKTTADALSASSHLDMEPIPGVIATKLQSLIESLATAWSSAIVLPLRVYVDQKSNDAEGSKWKSTYEAFETCIDSVVPDKVAKVSVWIEDQEVQRMIIKSTTDKVVDTYGRFLDMKPAGARGDAVGSMEERTLAEWKKVLDL